MSKYIYSTEMANMKWYKNGYHKNEQVKSDYFYIIKNEYDTIQEIISGYMLVKIWVKYLKTFSIKKKFE